MVPGAAYSLTRRLGALRYWSADRCGSFGEWQVRLPVPLYCGAKWIQYKDNQGAVAGLLAALSESLSAPCAAS